MHSSADRSERHQASDGLRRMDGCISTWHLLPVYLLGDILSTVRTWQPGLPAMPGQFFIFASIGADVVSNWNDQAR